MTAFFADCLAAARNLRRHPRFVLGAVATLALGLGATVTLMGVLDTLLFRPPAAVEQPDQIARVYFRHQDAQLGAWTNSSVTYPDLLDLSRSHSFASVAGITVNGASLGRGAEARPISLAEVAGDYFGLYRTRPLLGRLLQPADADPAEGGQALVLSERLWRTRFGADPAIVGRSMPLDDRVYTVVGVTAPGFDGGDFSAPDAWTPLGLLKNPTGEDFRTNRHWFFLTLITRLAPGATRAGAAAEATGIIDVALADSNERNGFQAVLLGPVQEARGPDHTDDARLALWLAAVSVVVLLIACANVANLLLARGLVRARELAVRKALGAGQARLVQQLLLEGLGVALLAGAAGVVATVWGGGLLRHFVLPEGMGEGSGLDGRLLAVALLATVVAALGSSLLPALRVVRGDLTPVLKEGGSGAGYRRSRLRAGLVVLQIGLSVLLVIGAGLFIQSLRKALAIDVGYDRSHVLMVSADPARAGFNGPAVAAAFDAMADAALRQGGVESAAITYGEPFGWSFARRLRVAGRDSLPRFSSGGPYLQSVTADYFRTMGLTILRGRGFSDADRREQPRVALLGATLARRYFGDADPIGQCLLLAESTSCTEVIGVVKDGVRYGPREEAQGMYYVPLPPGGEQTSHLTLFLRTRDDASRMAGALAPLLQTAVPDLPYVRLRPLQELLEPGYRTYRLGATLFTLFGVAALLLAGIGIYGVLAYAVRARTRELGIRLALGAAPVAVLRLVLSDGLRLALAGIGTGVLGALVLGRLLTSMLYGVAPGDPVTLALAVGTVLIAAAVASLLPARRATRIDPMTALRSE